MQAIDIVNELSREVGRSVIIVCRDKMGLFRESVHDNKDGVVPLRSGRKFGDVVKGYGGPWAGSHGQRVELSERGVTDGLGACTRVASSTVFLYVLTHLWPIVVARHYFKGFIGPIVAAGGGVMCMLEEFESYFMGVGNIDESVVE